MPSLIFQDEPQIFTTGAFLKPIQVTDSEGKTLWLWSVSEFTDSTFKAGEEYNPKECATTIRNCWKKFENLL